MTKTLILFRHAKSSWADNVEDHERPLAERGRKAAPVMAKWLVGKGLKPTVALVSTARRTQETWALVAPAFGKVTKRDAPAIYEAPAERIQPKVDEWTAMLRARPMLWDAVVAYFAHDLDVVAAARALHLHPNSLRYRLARVEKLLGRSLKQPSTIAALYVAMLAAPPADS